MCPICRGQRLSLAHENWRSSFNVAPQDAACNSQPFSLPKDREAELCIFALGKAAVYYPTIRGTALTCPGKRYLRWGSANFVEQFAITLAYWTSMTRRKLLGNAIDFEQAVACWNNLRCLYVARPSFMFLEDVMCSGRLLKSQPTELWGYTKVLCILPRPSIPEITLVCIWSALLLRRTLSSNSDPCVQSRAYDSLPRKP